MPGQVTLRFFDELNEFLPPEQRAVDFTHRFGNAGSVKDLVESVGVPHTEIDLILVNGASVNFGYRVRDGNCISVYPSCASLDISPVTRLRPPPLPIPRFVLDTHLGRLAAYVRMLGFDALYRNDYDDATLARLSADEHRALLTRDRKLLMRKQITHGYFVRARDPRSQLREIVARFDLADRLLPFSRCMHCNGPLQAVAKNAVADRLPPRVNAGFEEFRQCGDCRKVYWKGSHYERMQRIVASLEQR